MNNKYFNIVLVCLLSLSLMTSCDDDQADVSTINSFTFEIEPIQDMVVGESLRTVTVDFSLTEEQIVNTSVLVELVAESTTASQASDFAFASQVIDIPAYVRTGSFTFDVLEDLAAEGDENITFSISGVNDPFGAVNSIEQTVTIRDSVYETLNILFDFSGTITIEPDVFPICGNIDLDVYVLDADGNDLQIYDAATAACPESLVVDDRFVDGEYFLASNMFSNGVAGYGLNIPFPIVVTATKGGVFSTTFTPSEVWTSEDDDYYATGGVVFKPLAKITVSGNTYTVTDNDGMVLGSGIKGDPKLNKF